LRFDNWLQYGRELESESVFVKLKKSLSFSFLISCAIGLFLFWLPTPASAQADLSSDYYRPKKNNFPVGQCTWFVYGRIQEAGLIYGTVASTKDTKNILTVIGGNAKNWLVKAEQAGLETGIQPRAGAIACWTEWSGFGGFGHVAFVEAVNDGQPRVTESNVPIPKTMQIVAMANEKQAKTFVFPQKNGMEEIGEISLGNTRSVQDLGDLKSGKEGWCQLVPVAADFTARAEQLTISVGKYMTLSEAKNFPWVRRSWDAPNADGNFTGISISPAEPAYLDKAGFPNKYIYLSRGGGTSTTPLSNPGTSAVVLKLHSDVGLNQPVVASVAEGTTLQVIEGPVQAGEYVWWKLTGQPGTGWAAVEIKPNTIFQTPKECPVEVTAQFLWFHGSTKAQGTFYVATHDNVLKEQASLTSRKIKDLPVGTENTVIGGPDEVDGREWWKLTVGPDTGWAIMDRWGFTYPKE